MGDLSQDAADVAELLNSLSLIANHQGLLPALWSAIAPVEDLLNSDFTALQASLSDPIQRAGAEAAFKAALNLVNKSVQAKIIAVDDALEQGIALVLEAKDVLQKSLAFYNQLKVQLG